MACAACAQRPAFAPDRERAADTWAGVCEHAASERGPCALAQNTGRRSVALRSGPAKAACTVPNTAHFRPPYSLDFDWALYFLPVALLSRCASL